jgi:hypothetical protein
LYKRDNDGSFTHGERINGRWVEIKFTGKPAVKYQDGTVGIHTSEGPGMPGYLILSPDGRLLYRHRWTPQGYVIENWSKDGTYTYTLARSLDVQAGQGERNPSCPDYAAERACSMISELRDAW